jgi:phosphohistidine swiveling domain-containing protein
MTIQFSTKAETLCRLLPVLKKSVVLPQVCFTVEEWNNEQEACLKNLQNGLAKHGSKLIVRSSAITEDDMNNSNAGAFKTIGNVSLNNLKRVKSAIEEVIESFGSDSALENQVFVQPYLKNISMSGVVLTRDLENLAPYYIINYDDYHKSIGTVTSGYSGHLKTLVLFRNHSTQNSRFKRLLEAISEIEQTLNCDYLDIEFAIGESGKIFLLQVRPIVRRGKKLPDSAVVGCYLQKIYKKLIKLNKKFPYIDGEQTMFGIMPDWNPAEMIGTKPRPLALSLYKELITDRTWAYQRNNYGYKNLRSFPLLVTFIGHPYIDVRVSFNSFIPGDLEADLSSKICNYYLQKLKDNPHSHDKVEFDIILSCYFFNIDDKLKKLEIAGFSKEETARLKKSLLKLTNSIISPKDSVFYIDLEKIESLKIRQEKVLGAPFAILERIFWLIEDCKRYGTLPFAGLARAGFIAVQMLKSFVAIGLMSHEDLNRFMLSMNTVARQMAKDHHRLPKQEFLKRYGHLRPGTYDILSPCYEEAYDLYFTKQDNPQNEEYSYKFSDKVLTKLDIILKKEGITSDSSSLLKFIKEAIEGREYAKFVFTRSVSEILRHIKQLAVRYNFSTDDASFIDIRTILQLYGTLEHRDLAEILGDEIKRNRKFHEITKLIRLPHLIVESGDVYEFKLEEGMPNFVTFNRSQAEIVTEDKILTHSISEKIVFIASADPGYDWIFAKNIAGLVTMYGGANSHMAIRAAELNIPAIIGAGEKNFKAWSDAQVLDVDCTNELVNIIR